MKHFLLLFVLVFAVAAFGQEGMEAPAEEAAPDSAATEEVAAEEAAGDSAAVDMAADSTAMEAMEEMTEEAPVEEAVEEDAGDALEAMLAEEGMSETEVTGGSALIGYTVGFMGGYPVYMSSGMAAGTASPVFGAIFATPFGFAVGPFEIGVGAEIGMYDFNGDDENLSYNGLVAIATLNTALIETGQGAISAELGGGYYGASVGGTGGLTFTYAVPGVPLVVKPYVRANFTLDSGQELTGEGDTNSVGWINAGLYLSYDISTLF